MKAAGHPDYHMITVKMTNGESYPMRSTWGKEGDTLQLDVDPNTHPAWVGGVNLRKTGQMEKFNNKFSFLGASGGASKEAKTEAKAEKKAEAPKAEKKAAAPKAKKEDKKEDKKDA